MLNFDLTKNYKQIQLLHLGDVSYSKYVLKQLKKDIQIHR